jgi:hypothetical protein
MVLDEREFAPSRAQTKGLGAGDGDRTRNFQLGNLIQATFVYNNYTNA